ncbi:unnamed protein product [Kuraishia capsulata CBS 1993]|uniref:Protein yippee-like n=1 Tax=Kuraishia capsulata CBS 1993 TaxID=1382522 RepID=W6MQ31_9ASCO|nr:uncharacterized protein KUCA_T00004824001 [Kuraishia capsulata CBS 1993]CDK28839.1 unnamed protein product [Kuraishia capsulata CBS 1993]
MSENFYGSTGPAYYVSRVINCDLLKPEVKTMRTGKYTIRSLTCKQCGVDMGWKYIHSDNFKEKYKEGNYVIELGFLEQAEG